MTMTGQQITPLIETIHMFLRSHTDCPDDGMVVLANLIAFIYKRYSTLEDGTVVPLDTALEQLRAKVTEIVALNTTGTLPAPETLQ